MARSSKKPASRGAGTRKRKVAAAELPGQDDPRAPLDSAAFLAAARPVLATLRDDLLVRAEQPAVARALGERHEAERAAGRTADSFVEWRERTATQVAAAWLLSCVFVRTLEDRGLLHMARLAGPGAMDSQKLFFELAPSLTGRDYLLFVFRELAGFPAARDLFDAAHSLVWRLSPSADAARALMNLFRTPRADAPAFRFGQASTRFLGDLYQDLDEGVRKRYALLQTPDFIESFILDQTLDPAIERFGLDDTTLIDPTCGSGHFLLGAFARLFERRLSAEPASGPREAARKALDAVFGADINPYAVAIARFRLTLAYLERAEFNRLADAPALPLHLVVADSLLHNPHAKQTEFGHLDGQTSSAWGGELFALEDETAARDVLHRHYAAVVGNPPYITVKDAALRDKYRALYPRSAAGKYSLAAPFCERFFQLARDRGFVGQITANSFMKREFGKKLIEEFLPDVNLSLIINTSGAYIPGHGTPTVLLFGSAEPPTDREVLAVLAKRGEPSTPENAAGGLVWTSIVNHFGELGFENDYISVAKLEREKLSKHPWSLGGGGALELKEVLEERAEKRLGDLVDSIGFMAITGEDDIFARPRAAWLRHGAEAEWILDFGIGEEVRDWSIQPTFAVAFPYRDAELKGPDRYPMVARLLWPFRRLLLNRPDFGGKKYIDVGRTWFEYHQVPLERLRKPLSIAFAFVATHNHFVLDRGGKVFNRSAPIIKLPATATEDDHFALLAYLNSSTACFWMKQVFMNKGATSDEGVLQADEDKFRYEFDGTKMQQVPLPPRWKHRNALIAAARRISELAASVSPDDYLTVLLHASSAGELESRWRAVRESHQTAEELCVGLQEEIDWLVYDEFELVGGGIPVLSSELPAIGVGEGRRPFQSPDGDELHMARRKAIEKVPALSLVERSEFKRRWYRSQGKFNADAVDARHRRQDALGAFCLRIVEELHRTTQELVRAGDIKEALEPHIHIIELACRIAGTKADDPWDYAFDLVQAESVPFVASHRFTEDGLRKHEQWLRTWELQRAEDTGAKVPVSIPPKYGPKDYLTHDIHRLRGKLDVPKEPFISYPGCESDEDGEPVYGWAGWDHLQRAQALANLYMKRKTEESWPTERLIPMLAGLHELIAWVKQWHNDPNPDFNDLRMGDYFADFLAGELRYHSLTEADLLAWRPPKTSRRAGVNRKVGATRE